MSPEQPRENNGGFESSEFTGDSSIEHRQVNEREYLQLLIDTLRQLPLGSANTLFTITGTLSTELAKESPNMKVARESVALTQNLSEGTATQLNGVISNIEAYISDPTQPVAINHDFVGTPTLVLESPSQQQEDSIQGDTPNI